MKPAISDIRLARTLSWIIAGILALLPFHAFITTWLADNFGHHDLLRIWKELVLLLILPFVLILLRRSNKRWQQLKDSWIFRLFLLYIALHLVLGLWAIREEKVNSEALIYSYIINLRFLGFFFICMIVASFSDFLTRNWHKILLLPAAAVVGFGLLQKFMLPYDFLTRFGYGQGSIPAYQTVDSQFDLRRVQSFLRGANPLGAYLILIITALYFILRKSRIKQILAISAALIVMFFSYSRSAWLGLVVAFGFFAGYALARKKGPKLAFLAVAASVILIGGSIYALRGNSSVQDFIFHDRPQGGGVVTSNQERSAALKQGAKDVLNQPLGRGPGTAGPASFRNDSGGPRISENYFLQIGQEVGIIGMGVFIAVNILVALQLWARRNQTLPKVLLVSLLGITIANLLLHAWVDDTLAYLWWGLAGIALAPNLFGRKKTAKSLQ